MNNIIPSAIDFQNKLDEIFRVALQQRLAEITIKAGDLHHQIGGYPSKNHRMPVCCQVMRAAMRPGDEIMSAPPKGDGATLVIRYRLPRE